jgi:drug/metabolite transporter (DMT)-like permease
VLAVVLGLLVAAGYGSGDFLGGRASQSSSTAGVLLVSQASAAVGAVLVALAFTASISAHDLLLGLAAGTLNVIGLGLLYQGLSTGRMGVVAPVTAVVSAVFPVTWGLLEGERPSNVALAGVAGAIAAGALIGLAHGERSDPTSARRAVALAALAGLGLGGGFVLYAQTSGDSGNWPVLSARVAAVIVVGAGVAVLARRGAIALPRGRDRTLALGAGALDVTATALLLLAVRHGLIVVVAPVAALAPAMTVVLAWGFLKEHVARLQVVGLAVALPSLVLIAVG